MPSDPAPTGNYDTTFHTSLKAGARASADRLMPWVLELVAPASIVDVGCGSGEWLAVAAAHGVTDYLGVDGPWVAHGTLEIPLDRFRTENLAAPLDLGRSFDLALCLEVAEHLPPEAGPVLVQTLTAHAPVVLFSAAVPGQGGEGHVNEAWPSYWRDQFAARRFLCVDVVRPRVWADADIEPWYRQNTLLFVADTHLPQSAELARHAAATRAPPLDIVHPALFNEVENQRAAAAEETSRLLRTLNALQAAHDETKQEIDRLRESRSWRLTAPLRHLKNRFGTRKP